MKQRLGRSLQIGTTSGAVLTDTSSFEEEVTLVALGDQFGLHHLLDQISGLLVVGVLA